MKKAWLPIVSGILDIPVGLFQLLGAVFFFGMSHVDVMAGRTEEAYSVVAVLTLNAFLAMFGGIYNIRRTNWPLAMAGSIAASWFLPLVVYFIVFEIASPFLIIALPGIAAIVLTVLSKKEFE